MLKKLIMAAMLVVLPAAGNAETSSLLLECGGHIVQLVSQPQTNYFKRIIADNEMFNEQPGVTRQMDKGEVVTFFEAWKPGTMHSVTVAIWEKGGVFAMETNDKRQIWRAECRQVK